MLQTARELSGQRDFGHEKQRLVTSTQYAVDEMDIYFCLAA